MKLYSSFDIRPKYKSLFTSGDFAVKINNKNQYNYILQLFSFKYYVYDLHFETKDIKFPYYLGVRTKIGNYTDKENWYGNNIPFGDVVSIEEFKLNILNKEIMGKIEEKLLEDFKKANATRKLKLANKFGFSTAQEYEEHLTGNSIAIKVNKPKKAIKSKKTVIPTIHNVILLDATGSMAGGKYSNSMKGIEKELDWIKQQTNVNYTYTLREFIESGSKGVRTNEHCFISKPSEVKLNFHGAVGGNTPLYKATLDIISDIQSKVLHTDKILLKVYTDGENNSLGNFKSNCRDLISKVQSENVTVTFVGTKADLKRIITDLNLEESNCLEIENTGEGFEQAMTRSLGATQSYASNVVAGKDVSKGFYKKIN